MENTNPSAVAKTNDPTIHQKNGFSVVKIQPTVLITNVIEKPILKTNHPSLTAYRHTFFPDQKRSA
jgi:hypothetical protein